MMSDAQSTQQPNRYWVIHAANGALAWDRSIHAFVPVRQLANQYNEIAQRMRTAWHVEAEVLAKIEELQSLGVMARAGVYQVEG